MTKIKIFVFKNFDRRYRLLWLRQISWRLCRKVNRALNDYFWILVNLIEKKDKQIRFFCNGQ